MALSKMGFIQRDPSEIKEAIVNKIKEKLPEFGEFAADIQNNLIDTAIADILQYEQLAAVMLNSIALDFSSEMLFRQQAEQLGLRQKKEFKSQANITFYGLPGDFIPQNTKIQTIDKAFTFETQKSAIIGESGQVSVLAFGDCEKVLPAHEVCVLKSILSEGITCENLSPTLERIEPETFNQFKFRSQARLRSPRMGGKLYALSIIKSLEAVNPRLVAINPVNYQESYDDPTGSGEKLWGDFKGVRVIVGGGDKYEIAHAIYKSFFETQKVRADPSDKDENRIESVDLNIFNSTINIKFLRPKPIIINLKVFLAMRNSTINAYAIQEKALETLPLFFKESPVGANINKMFLYEFFIALLKEMGVESWAIKSLDFMYDIGHKERKRKADSPIDWQPDKYEWKDFNDDGDLPEIVYDCYPVFENLEIRINTPKGEQFDDVGEI